MQRGSLRAAFLLPGFSGLLTACLYITTIFDMKASYLQAMPEAWQPMSAVFTALGDPHRQRILLMFEAGERLNVGQVAGASPLARSTVSHHLKVLRQAGVLLAEKQGKEVWFRINRPLLETTLGNVLAYLQENA